MIWSPRLRSCIHPNRGIAKEKAPSFLHHDVIFTDGSSHGGGVGAAAVTSPGNTDDLLRLHLGNSSSHTVFEAEITGTILALHIVREKRRPRNTIIALDNTATIKALMHPRLQPAQHLLLLFHEELSRTLLRHPHITITLQWVPGHEGIAGNEYADSEAKKAAAGDSKLPPHANPALTRPLPTSVAALKANMKTRTRNATLKHFTEAPKLARIRRLDRVLPNTELHRTYATLPRRAASILTQLCTGHIALNSFLHRIGAADSDLCSHCRAPETTDHFILHCNRYVEQRRTLRNKLKGPLNSLRAVLARKRGILAVVQYVRDTKRLQHYVDK